MNKTKADIGIIGGSGFYHLRHGFKQVQIRTPYGPTSDSLAIGEIGGRKVAFLPRHGRSHQYPPHLVPYAANIYALKSIGVGKIIAPCASGSLKPSLKPGDFVLCDQFVDFTKGRLDSFFQGKASLHNFTGWHVAHISPAKPYCDYLRSAVLAAAKKTSLHCHPKGTVVVINGPRFSTTAESSFYKKNTWDVINMTQYPEVVLAREMGICYASIALVTDYDTGIIGKTKIKPVSADEVMRMFVANTIRLKRLILQSVKEIDLTYPCTCCDSLKSAKVS